MELFRSDEQLAREANGEVSRLSRRFWWKRNRSHVLVFALACIASAAVIVLQAWLS